jgi:hypothetical protein
VLSKDIPMVLVCEILETALTFMRDNVVYSDICPTSIGSNSGRPTAYVAHINSSPGSPLATVPITPRLVYVAASPGLKAQRTVAFDVGT